MKISIVTVVYNAASLLEETMTSVFAQDYPDLEYIIIDGGSTDGTLDIIERYRQQLAVVISEPDKGIYDAMNKGIACATGDVIGMINAGDYYYPNAFQLVAAALAGQKLDEVVFWGDVMYEHLGRVRGFRPENRWRGAFSPHPSMFCPRVVYERIGTYDLQFRLMGDYDFMYRAINVKNLRPVYEPTFIAFYREGGLSDRNIVRCLREEYLVKRKYGRPWLPTKLVYFLKLLKNAPRILKSKFSVR